uniref:Uncharacterized protein n=1 Tax=Arundo donax TaxID=35708 RepID=A0A0A9APL9_ARUDO
MCDFLNLYND